MSEEDQMARMVGDLQEKMAGSAVVLQLVPLDGDLDWKFCIELGAAVMLDKPILACVRPGARVPLKLAKIADEILEADITTVEGRADLVDRLRIVTDRLKGT